MAQGCPVTLLSLEKEQEGLNINVDPAAGGLSTGYRGEGTGSWHKTAALSLSCPLCDTEEQLRCELRVSYWVAEVNAPGSVRQGLPSSHDTQWLLGSPASPKLQAPAALASSYAAVQAASSTEVRVAQSGSPSSAGKHVCRGQHRSPGAAATSGVSQKLLTLTPASPDTVCPTECSEPFCGTLGGSLDTGWPARVRPWVGTLLWGTALSSHCLQSSPRHSEAGIIIPISQMGKLRPRERQQLIQDHLGNQS